MEVLGFEPKHPWTPVVDAAEYPEGDIPAEPLARPEPWLGAESPEPDLSQAKKAYFWRLASDLPAPDDQATEPQWLQDAAAEPIPPDAFEADPLADARAPVPLVRPERLARFLHGQLTSDRPGPDLDVPAVVARIASGRACDRLPVRPVRRWPYRVDLVRERHSGLAPMHADMNLVQRHLTRWLGSRLRVLEVREGSRDPGWLVDPEDPAEWRRRAGAGGGVVVVLGDGGLLSRDVAERAAWQRFAVAVRRAGKSSLRLCPLPRRMVAGDSDDAFRTVLMDESPHLRVLTRRALASHSHSSPVFAETELSPAARALLGLIAGASFVPAALLRSLRRALPRAGLDGADVGAEIEVFRHLAETQDGLACRVPAHEVPDVIANLAILLPDPDTRDRLRLLSLKQFAQGSPLVAAAHTQAQSVLPAASSEFKAAQMQAFDAAQTLFTRMAAELRKGMQQSSDRPADRAGLGHFLRWSGRAMPALIGQGGKQIQAAWAMAEVSRLRRGDLPVPIGVSIGDLSWLLQTTGGRPHALVLHATPDTLHLELMPETEAPPGVLARGLREAPLFDVTLLQGLIRSSVRHERPGTAVSVAMAKDGIGPGLNVAGRRLELERFSRPDWLQRVEREGDHWFGVLPDGRRLRWVPRRCFRIVGGQGEKSFELPHGAWWDDAEYTTWAKVESAIRCPGWANAGHGVDGYGYWAEFRIGDAVQRMRFIPPGEFEMGSADKADSPTLEARLHPVAITRGFWLADTALTMKMWRAAGMTYPNVFGGDPDLPMENLSWEDVSRSALSVLRALDPGLRLPTEAEWEYSAREAGHAKSRRYWWGDEISPPHANFGSTGTVPVKLYAPNACGLWILGNVWEWVHDVATAFPHGMAVDPNGARAHAGRPARRVLRGGGWSLVPQASPLACRRAELPDYRFDNIGFRLARGLRDQPPMEEIDAARLRQLYLDGESESLWR